MADLSSVDTIMEEREELMVSPTGGNPTLRTAHFLNPTLTSRRDIPLLSISSNPTISELNKTPLKVLFKGRLCLQNGWKTWVERLQPAYQHVWKKAGIYDAILASTYQTMRHNDLVIGLAQRWCFETNTFIFPWGEATITLEDMVVLGGYSVLGYPVFNPLQTKDLIEIEEHLSKAHRDIRLGCAKIASHYAWLEHFMEIGDPFEHEAFLVLWLSRYVFPSRCNTVGRDSFPIAIHLSRGTPIALAPAVLASIYRDLSFLKKSMIALTKLGTNCECEGDDDALTVNLWAPLHLVQLWAWERFPTLRPKPNPIRCGEPRVARWHRLKRLKVENVGIAMGSASECFQWRPYATVVNNWMFSKFYRESEEWVLVKSDMDKELESFARCLSACELVGLDCIEQYLPHRVAMQFGMDQDVPGHVTRSNETPEIAWRNYIRPIKDAELYIPYRLFESDVTKRYSEWWKQSMLAYQDAIKGVESQQSSKTCKRLPRVFRGHLNDNYDFVQSGFPSKQVKVEDVDEDKLTITEILRNYDFVPSGCPSKHFKVEDVDEDKLTIAEKLRRCYDKHNSFGETTMGDHMPVPDSRFQNSSSLAVVNRAGRNMESLMKPIEMSMQDKILMRGPKRDTEAADASKAMNLSIRVNDNEEAAHFLQPTVTHIDGPTLKPPQLSSESKWHLKVAFHGWRDPPKKWKSWVDHMHSLHESIWKKAGICEAVLGSTHTIRVNNDLVLGIAERWSSETNTFIFPWGEATITLEDMMVLGGFSVLGASVSMPLQAQELLKIEENLNQARIGLVRSKAQKAHHCLWIKHFMQSGSEIEHEAFLTLWLSRFVFPGNVYDTISKHVFPIAIHLARGTRLALAPAVLASLYRDLSLLKETIAASTELEANANDDSSFAVTLWAPLKLAQCWAWERLPPLQPQPNVIKSGEPRMARWHSLKRSNFENVRQDIDSAGEIFQWRPYVTAVQGLSFPKFYKEKEEWASSNLNLDEELESFARCLRVGELVGLDCREQYFPHRVAMQFGMDQDLLGWVPRSNATPEIAWNKYSRPESDVTIQYLEWWKQEVFDPQDAIKGIVQRKRSPRKWKRMSQNSKEMKGGNDADVPPGFPPKCKKVEADKHTLEGMLQTTSNDKPLFDSPSQTLSYSASDDGASRRTKPAEQIMQGEFATKISETGIENAHNIDSNKSNEKESSRDSTFRLPELELEARILELERVVAALKVSKFSTKCVK